jgi:hypothetical protein
VSQDGLPVSYLGGHGDLLRPQKGRLIIANGKVKFTANSLQKSRRKELFSIEAASITSARCDVTTEPPKIPTDYVRNIFLPIATHAKGGKAAQFSKMLFVEYEDDGIRSELTFMDGPSEDSDQIVVRILANRILAEQKAAQQQAPTAAEEQKVESGARREPVGGSDPEARLKRLQRLLDQGLIAEEEFTATRSRILEEL